MPPLIDSLISPQINYGEIIISSIAIIILLGLSALISAAEIALFSLSAQETNELKNSEKPSKKRAYNLLKQPGQLLCSLMIAKNFLNIAIIIISLWCTSIFLPNQQYSISAILLQLITITILIIICTEITPKTIAVRNPKKYSQYSSSFISIISLILKPITSSILRHTIIFNKQIEKYKHISIDELSQALEITSKNTREENDLIKGIIALGNISADKIMIARTDMVTININDSFSDVTKWIIKNEYSRIPVYANSLDDITGILYTKDLLPHLNKDDNFNWQSLLRPAYFIPETIKIDDLLHQFQKDRTHIAIVVDEFGGTSGLITMEDILEEVVGDISDEFDEEENLFIKIDDSTYIYEAKITLTDFAKSLNIDTDFFDNISSETDTLAGLILEIKGEIPKVNDQIKYKDMIFDITEANNRRIIKVKLTIQK